MPHSAVDKAFARIRAAAAAAGLPGIEEGTSYGAPGIYYETDHYKGWPAVLVRLSEITDQELAHRLTIAWRDRAGKRLVSQFEASR
jgi:hypothetical protein